MRELYAYEPVVSSGLLSAGDSDWWQSSVPAASSGVTPKLLVALTMLSGTATVFSSNLTIAPNASTAQQTQADVSAAAVLAFEATAAQSNEQPIYFTVWCTSNDTTPCEYTLLAEEYYTPPPYMRDTGWSSLNAPYRLLLPAGGVYWVTYESPSTLPYVIMQAAATVGTPSLYASCATWPISDAQLPNATNSMWQAVTAPLAIELANFSSVAAQCPEPVLLVLGVYASGGQAALVTVVSTAAGSIQDVTDSSTAYGIVTPAYPTGYFVYTLWSENPSVVLAFTLTSSGSNGLGVCSTSRLQMVVSDTTPLPNPADPSTYNLSRTAVTLANGVVDFTIAITASSRPVGILHTGDYYIAVTTTADVRDVCSFELQSWDAGQRELELGYFMGQDLISARGPAYFSFAPVQYNTSTSFAVRLYNDVGVVIMYVGIDSTPSPADPSTYLLAIQFVYDSTKLGPDGSYTAPPIYVPASACSSAMHVDDPCSVSFMAVSSVSSDWQLVLWVLPMSSASAVWLLEDETAYGPVDKEHLSSTFQLSLPASPLLVHVTVNASSAVTVSCSYQYVTPQADESLYDWQSSSSHSPVTGMFTAPLTFTWGTPQLLTNPDTLLAAAPTYCFCTVQAADDGPYSIVYTTAPLNRSAPSKAPSSSTTSPSASSSLTSAVSASSSTLSSTISSSSSPSISTAPPAAVSSSSAFIPSATSLFTSHWVSSTSSASTASFSSRSGLTSGALAAAVVVPLLAVLLLVGVLLAWICRRRGVKCVWLVGKGKYDGRVREHLDEVESGGGVTMAELITDGRLMRSEEQSDET